MSAERIKTGAIPNAFVAEGATNVWGDAMRGIHSLAERQPSESLSYEVAVLALHRSIIRDGIEQPMRENPNYGKFLDTGIGVHSLSRDDDGSGVLPVYNEKDLEQMTAFVENMAVVTALEEYPLGALHQLDVRSVPPIVANLYRSGAFKSDQHIHDLQTGLEKGIVAHATVDAFASREAYIDRGISPEDITVIPNGIDTDTFAPSPENRANIRKELAIPIDAPTILLVGRDSPEKDIPLFIKSARKYLEQTPEGHIIMSGAGLSLNNQNIATLINENFDDAGRLKERLHLLGIRPDVAALYNASDVLALTSATESRPLCISEAQASGLGVAVSTAVGDAPIMIGQHGFITDRNPTEIASRWIEAYAKRDTIGFPLERRQELSTGPMIRRYADVINATLTHS